MTGYTKCISQIFYISDLRSCQFCDLPTISQWDGFHFILICVKTIPSRQNMQHVVFTSHLSWQLQSDDLCNEQWRSRDVIIGHQQFSRNNFWLRHDTGFKTSLTCLSYRDEPNDMNHNMFVSGHDLDLRSKFPLDLLRSYYISIDAAWWQKHRGDWIIILATLCQKLC